MNSTEVNRFTKLYQRHLRLLKLQGKSQKIIDAYSRAVRRVSEYFDCCPDKLTTEQLETYFEKLLDTHSYRGHIGVKSPVDSYSFLTRVNRRLDPIPVRLDFAPADLFGCANQRASE